MIVQSVRWFKQMCWLKTIYFSHSFSSIQSQSESVLNSFMPKTESWVDIVNNPHILSVKISLGF